MGQAKIFGVVGHHEEIQGALQRRLLTRIAGDGFTAGKAVGLVEPELGARQTGIGRQGGVQVGVTEVSAVATGALGVFDGKGRR